jgi:predicted Zn-dependent protease
MPYMPNATLRVTVALVLLLVLFVVACFTVPPFYRKLKVDRAIRAAAQAEIELEKGDWTRAGNRIKLSLSLAPTEPAVLRTVGRFCTRLGSPVGLQYWQLLVESGQATRSDRIDYVKNLLQVDQPEPARKILVELLKENIRDFECLELSFRALLLEQRTKDALIAAEAMVEYFPSNDKGQFELGRTLLAQQEPSLQAKGEVILWGLALRENPFLLQAIGTLSSRTNLSRTELQLLSRRLPAEPSLGRGLLGLELDEKLGRSPSRTDLAAAAIRALPTNSPIDSHLALADWLFARSFHSEGLQVLPTNAIRTNTAVLQRYLQGLGGLQRWKEASSLVEDPELPLTRVLRDVFRAVVASRIGTPEEVTAHLGSAAAGTRDDPSLARLVAGYAEAFDQPAIAAEALQSLMANPSNVQRTGPKLMRLLSRVDDTQPLLQAIERLLQFTPDDPNLRNDRAWWLLVTGQRIEECRATAQELIKAHPDRSRYLATLALSYTRENNPDKALQLIEQPFLQATNPSTRVRLVYCAALGLAGQREAARRIGASLPKQSLRSAERALVAEWIEPAPL